MPITVDLDYSLHDILELTLVEHIQANGIADILNNLEDICYELSEETDGLEDGFVPSSWRHAAELIAECAAQIRGDEIFHDGEPVTE